jgi:hypothetical protein
MADFTSIALNGTDALRSFIKSRMLAFDPSIDTTDGAPIYNEVIDPIIARLGADPFSLDITTFITQRISETFPNIYLAAEFEDLFINPVKVILEKLVEQIKAIRLGQSLKDPDLLSEEEMDDLGSLSYVTRKQGGFATVTARVYYATPRTLSINTDVVFTSKSGLRFFPTQNQNISSAQMLLNREGFEYFVDVPLTAEEAGDEYNVIAGDIDSVEDLQNPIRVINFRAAQDGIPKEDNVTYSARIEQSRTEQSLVTKRGATSKTLNDFNIRGMEVIGNGELGMDRDILVGTTEGKALLTFTGAYFSRWVYLDVSNDYFDKGINGTDTISVGDKIRFRKELGNTPGTVREAKILRVLFSTSDKFFLEIDTDFGSAYYGQIISGIVYKPGYITVSKIPGGNVQKQVPDNEVHIGGHTDVYVASTDNGTAIVDVENIVDETSYFKTIVGGVTVNTNKFITSAFDNFETLGITIGDLLIIESGTQIGTYEILDVITTELYVNSLFTVSETNLRARVVKQVSINFVAPKNIKLPYNSTVSDLNVIVGSTLFRTPSNDLLSYGVVVGDTIEILVGANKGKYTITGFDGMFGGFGPIVDKPALSTDINLTYKVYSEQEGIVPPFVRVEKIETLDSNKQPTNIDIPYGDLVDVRASCDFERRGPYETINDKRAIFFPDLTSVTPITPDPATPSSTTDARYTQKLESYDGVLRKVTAKNTNPIVTIEVNLPPFLYNNKKNKILSLVTGKDTEFLTDPSGNPQTSPFAKAKPGHVLTIMSGPNVGTYLIKDVRKFSLWGKNTDGHYEIGYLEIDGEFPFDPINDIVSIISYGNLIGSGVTNLTFSDYFKMVEYSTDWTNGSGFIEGMLLPKFEDTLTYLGFTVTTQEVRDIINSVILTNYSIGAPITGQLRCYTKEPVTTVLHPQDKFTFFSEVVNTTVDVPPKIARLAPITDIGQIFPTYSTKVDISNYPRNASQKYPASTSLYLTSGESFAKRGIRTGDLLEIHTAINDYPSRGNQNSSYLAITQAGSNIVDLILPSTRNNQTALTAGQLLYIDTGPDSSNPFFVITEVMVDSFPLYRVRLNRTATFTTELYPTFVSFSSATVNGGTSTLTSASFPGNVAIGDWISIYAATSTVILTAGEDAPYLGTFQLSNLVTTTATLSRTATFPANATCMWIKVPAPTTPPTATSGGGTELSTAFVRFRQYSNVVTKRDIVVDWSLSPNPLSSSSQDQITLNTSITSNGSNTNFSHKSPFRILRPNTKVISSTENASKRANGLYYFDVDVVSMGLPDDFIFERDHAFVIDGTYEIEGYKVIPDNHLYSYSTKETGIIRFPNSFLPNGATYDKTNYISTAGKNIRISYDTCPTISAIQDFYDSPLDRITVANFLIRHFLPGYIYLEVTYSGGKETSVIANQLQTYIYNSANDPFRRLGVDDIEAIVKKNGASQITNPIQLVCLVEDQDRNFKVVRSFNQILNTDLPIFNGLHRMVIFMSGLDVSTQTTLPDKEYIYLKRN